MSCRNLRKPVLARNTVGALRFAWLRAPPSHRPKPNPDPSEVRSYLLPGSEITPLATSLFQMNSTTSAPMVAVMKPAP